MSDSYQAIYDGVRSRISNANVGEAVESALRELNLSHYAQMAGQAAQEAAWQHQRPCVLFRPKIFPENLETWCALYGENLQEGVAGFGNSPEAAMCDFDNNWTKKTGGQP